MCRKYDIDIIFKTMRKYLSTLLVASVLAASCTKDAEVIREKIVNQSRPILSGQGQPENTKGEDGDYYLDLANADLYGPKTKGAWGAPALNLRGVAGKDGKDGKDGQNGQDGQPGRDGQNGTNGITPTISEDGYWVINNQKTDIKARGNDGQPGAPGQPGTPGRPGANGQTPTITISEDGYWVINNQKTTEKARGNDGQPGAPGQPGANGQTPTITISEDGYWVINNQKTTEKARGNDGQPGAPGRPGADGQTPTITISEDGYWVINGVTSTTKARGNDGQPGAPGRNGQDGADGSKILAEDRAPQASDGVVGDYFIDKDAKIFYGPKTTSGWPSTGISLTGAPRATVDYQLSEDGKTLVKWLNPKTSYIDMNLDPKLRDVTTIADGAFSVPGLRDRLSTIIIGDDVTEIQASAFHGCGALRRVELPEGLTAIAPNTFEACMSLQYINIPETVTSIGSYAFANCTKLKKITIPKEVGRFEARTFVGCTALKTLVLENPIAFNIDQVSNAFAGTTLTSIFVPHAAKQAYKDANRADRKAIIKSVVIE